MRIFGFLLWGVATLAFCAAPQGVPPIPGSGGAASANGGSVSEEDLQSLNRKAPPVAYDKIAPYLAELQIISPSELEQASRVDSIQGPNPTAGTGDKVLADRIAAVISGKQASFFVFFETGDSYTDPQTGKVLGFRVEQKGEGVLQTEGTAQQKPVLWVRKATEPVKVGDYIAPMPDQVALSFVPTYSGVALESQIIGLFNRAIDDTGIHKDDIVVIIGGTERGLKPGDQLQVYRSPKALSAKIEEYSTLQPVLMEITIGDLLVFRTFQNVSFAIVTSARQPLHLLDKVVNF